MYTNTRSGRIFQDLRGYLLGAGQGPVFPLVYVLPKRARPVFPLECAGFEYCRPAELILSCTPSNLTSIGEPQTPAISFSLYTDASVPLHVLFLLPGIPFHFSCSHLPAELSLILKSLGKQKKLSCEKLSLMLPGRLSFSLLYPQSSLNTPVIHRSLVSISHTMGNTVNAFRVGIKCFFFFFKFMLFQL